MSKLKANMIALVLVVIVSFVLILCLKTTIQTAKKGRLEERFHSLVLEVNTRIEELEAEDFEGHLNHFLRYFEIIDRRTNVFSAVYTSSLNELSVRKATFAGQPFDPFKYPEIVNAIENDKNGIQDAVFSVCIDRKTDYRPIRIYFCRVPISNDDYLIVIAGFAFTEDEDNVELQPYLYTLLYIVFGLASVSFGVIIFIGTHFVFMYQKNYMDFRKKMGLE